MATDLEKSKALLSAYKAGVSAKKRGKKKRRVQYVPIGRTLTTLAGVLKMVNAGNIKMGLDALMNGQWGTASSRLGAMFEGGDVKGGSAIIGGGIVLGKALDGAKVNPKIAVGGYGIKLV